MLRSTFDEVDIHINISELRFFFGALQLAPKVLIYKNIYILKSSVKKTAHFLQRKITLFLEII